MMLQQRAQYWSNSKFAQWLRKKAGIPLQPPAATLEEWEEIHKKAREANKVVDWIIEEVLDRVQNFLWWPYDAANEVRYYICNRWIDRCHLIDTKLQPGRFYEADTRLFHGIFQSVVDFVEINKAHMTLMSRVWSGKKVPLKYRFSLLRWGRLRSRELGLEHLNWESKLDDPTSEFYDEHMYGQPIDCSDGVTVVCTQAHAARELIAIYTWWKDVRPNRPDAYEVSGWSAWCDEHRKAGNRWGSPKTPEEEQKVRNMLKENARIEQQYEDEDDLMIARVMKIRRHMWT